MHVVQVRLYNPNVSSSIEVNIEVIMLEWFKNKLTATTNQIDFGEKTADSSSAV